MRNGKIIVGGAAVVLLSSAFSFNALLKNDDSSSTYVPRTHVFSMEDKSVADQQADYERRRINLATGLYEPEVIKAAREEAIRYNKTARGRAVTMGLTELGPDNIGGRTRAIAVDPRDQNHMITGSVSGQLYETFDRANTWNKITSFPTVSIGSIAISDVAPYRILVGIVNSWDPVGQPDGIWESTDDGATWTQVSGTSGFNYVNDIYPVAGQDKFIIGCSAGLREYDGSSISTPAGAPAGGCTSLSVSKDNQIYIATFGTTKRVSTDGGANWQTLTGTDVGPGSRVEFAISDVKVNGKYYVYASVTNGNLASEHVSTSNGEPGTWSETATTSTLFEPFNGQGTYNSCISVYPGRADKIVIGGIDLYDWIMDPGSNPAFGQWAQISFWAASPQSPIYVHADNHFFAWNPDGDMIITNDGGIGISPAQAIGQVFFPANKGFNVTQFYNIGYSAHGHVIGGTQDNGTLHNDYTNNSFMEFEELLGGDGFSADISILDEDVLFGSLYYGGFSRSNDGGFTWGSFTSGQMNSCGAFGSTGGGGVGGFNTVTRLWETNNDLNSTDSLMFIPNSTMNPGDTAFIESASLGIELSQILTSTMTVIDTLNPDGTVVQGTDTLNYFLNPNNGDTIDISFDDYLVNVALDTLMIQDKIQSWYGFGVQFGTCEGVWLTRDAVRFSNTPFWWKFEDDDAGTNIASISDIEFSKDGNHMYIGTSSGNLFRVSGLNTLYANEYDAGWSASDPSILPATVTVTRIYSGSNISGICVDPNDPDHVVITHAGFGTSQIKRTTTATTDAQTSGAGSFSSMHGSLPSMPVYDVEIHRDYATNGLIVIGTEFGIYATDNGSTWDVISSQNDLGMTPVYSVRQNWRGFNEGSYRPGELYFGTFGAGIWASSDFLSTPDDITHQEPGVNFIASLNVYPNPMSTNGNIAFEMNERSNVTIEVYSLGGRLVKRINAGSMGQGSHTLDINVEDMSNGTYIVNMIAGQSKKTAKIIVNR